MPSKFLNVAIFSFAASMLLWCGPAAPRVFGDQFWYELTSSDAPKAETLPDFVSMADKLGPAVVNISTEQAGPAASEGEGGGSEGGGNQPFNEFGEPFGEPHGRSLGSGFIINAAGYILTNDHVIENGREIMVTTRDGNQYKASVTGRDAKTDIALLKINARHDLPVAPLGDSDEVKVGQWVMTIGDPFGFDHTVTAGIISAKGRFIPGNYDEFIQTDAAINPGNSGGPLINVRGEVVGVNSAIFTRTGSNTGIGFAIPVNLVKEELPQLRDHGKVVRGWLGIYVQRVTPAIADSMGLEEPRGALVAEVLGEGPAKNAGIKRGDVIAAYNGRPDRRFAPVAADGRAHPARPSRDAQDSPRQKIPRAAGYDYGLARDAYSGCRQAANQGHLAVRPHRERPRPQTRARDGTRPEQRRGGLFGAARQLGRRGRRCARATLSWKSTATASAMSDAYQRALKLAGGKAVLLLIKRHNSTVFVPLEPEG